MSSVRRTFCEYGEQTHCDRTTYVVRDVDGIGLLHGKFPRDKLLFSIENLDWLVFSFLFSPTSLLILRHQIAMHWFFNHFFFFRLTNDDEPISGEIRLHWSALFWNFRFSAFHLVTAYRQRQADFILKAGARRRCKRTNGGKTVLFVWSVSAQLIERNISGFGFFIDLVSLSAFYVNENEWIKKAWEKKGTERKKKFQSLTSCISRSSIMGCGILLRTMPSPPSLIA